MYLGLPNGDKLEVEKGQKVIDIAYDIGEGLGNDTIGAKLDDTLLDLREPVTKEGKFTILTLDSPQAVEIYRHTASHIMAQAVQHLFSDVQLAIGPAIEDGFYYDFDLPHSLSEEDFLDIKEEMNNIIDQDLAIERFTEPIKKARQRLKADEQSYKLELLQDLAADGAEEVSFYRQGDFVDLCQGPHLKSTGQVENFELLDVAGAYWKGDEDNKMLQRIYATAFPDKKDLDQYLQRQQEAKERDHRKLGPELDLFTMHPEVGSGLIYWHPKGARVRKVIKDFWEEKHLNSGYELVSTPHIGKRKLWEKSGHIDYFKENMYPPMKSGQTEYYLKPMNCPFHIQIYKSKTRSYRDLPLRWAELGTVYRYERSGVLHGLLRARGFTQDDAHIICRPDQVEEEIIGVLDFTFELLSAFGFDDYELVLATRPEQSVGEDHKWDQAIEAIRGAMEKLNLGYEIEQGEGAFYGPKIDINLKDALGRSWQCTTVQFDFNLPERFDMNYTGSDGREHRPYMIHRALLGAIERFFGILVEHYKGAFPVWLAPVQAVVLPITEDHNEYAEKVKSQLDQAGLRAEAWTDRDEALSGAIRKAQLQKIPYMLVVGDNEQESGEVSLRLRTEDDLGPRPVQDFIEFAQTKIENKEKV